MASKLWATRLASFLKISAHNRGFATVSSDLKYGNVIFVELPREGARVEKGASFGSVETMKSSSNLNSPVSGKVVEVNMELTDSPGLMNASPYGKGWMIKVEMTDTEEVKSLMDSELYSKFCEEEED